MYKIVTKMDLSALIFKEA